MNVALAALILAVGSLLALAPAAQAAPGDSAADPIVITDCDGLSVMASGLDKYYKLGNDIDCTGVAFSPIGNSGPSDVFTGQLDGNNKVISNLHIDNFAITFEQAGLFTRLGSGAVIKNLGLEDVNTFFETPSAEHYAGMVAAVMEAGSTIQNVYVTGEITCQTDTMAVLHVGGLVGFNAGTIENSYSSADIDCTSNSGLQTINAGGLVGRQDGTVRNSFTTGTVSHTGTALANLGGLFGIGGGTAANTYSVMNSAVGSGSGSGTTADVLIGSFYDSPFLYPVYIGTPPWDFDNIWQFENSSSLPTFRTLSSDTDGDGTNNTTGGSSVGAPNTGLPQENALTFGAAFLAGCILALSQIAFVRRSIYDVFKK